MVSAGSEIIVFCLPGDPGWPGGLLSTDLTSESVLVGDLDLSDMGSALAFEVAALEFVLFSDCLALLCIYSGQTLSVQKRSHSCALRPPG